MLSTLCEKNDSEPLCLSHIIAFNNGIKRSTFEIIHELNAKHIQAIMTDLKQERWITHMNFCVYCLRYRTYIFLGVCILEKMLWSFPDDPYVVLYLKNMKNGKGDPGMMHAFWQNNCYVCRRNFTSFLNEKNRIYKEMENREQNNFGRGYCIHISKLKKKRKQGNEKCEKICYKYDQELSNIRKVTLKLWK